MPGGSGSRIAIAPSTPGRHRLGRVVEHLHVVARHPHRRRAGLDRHRVEPAQVRGDRPAGLGLPPVVDDRHAEQRAGPLVGVGVEPLAGEEDALERAEVVAGHQGAVGVLALDRPVGGGGGEHGLDAMVADDPPERARIGGADRFAFVENGGGAGEQGCVDDVGVPDDPADIGCREPHVARADVVDVLHRPAQGHRVAAVVAHDALRAAGGAGGVEHVERVCRRDLDAVGRLGVGDQLVPVDLLPVGVTHPHLGAALLALQHDHGLGLVLAAVERGIQHRLVLDDPAGLDAAARSHDDGRLGVLDPRGQLGRCEPAEDDRVDGAEPGAGEHRHDRLGHHRHVDHDPVALLDPQRGERAGEGGDLVEQLGVGEGGDRVRDGAVVDQGRLVATPVAHVAVEGVEAGVERAAPEPSVEGRVGVVEHAGRLGDPLDRLRGIPPEGVRVGDRLLVCRCVGAVAHDPIVDPPGGGRATGSVGIVRGRA